MTSLVVSNRFPIWIEYWDPNEPHGHILMIKAEEDTVTMQDILSDMEGYAGELVEMFYSCGNQSHGKGIKHSMEVTKRAYEAGVFQLLTTDYQMEWEESQRKQRVYKLWGGQVPAFILQPKMDDAGVWEAIVPDKEGRPWVYGVKKNVLDDWDPRELGAKPNRYGGNGLGGWTLPKGRN